MQTPSNRFRTDPLQTDDIIQNIEVEREFGHLSAKQRIEAARLLEYAARYLRQNPEAAPIIRPDLGRN